MELLLALALIVAVNELNAWRLSRRHRQLLSSFKSMKRQIVALREEVCQNTDQITVAKVGVATLHGQLQKQTEELQATKDFIHTAEADLKTILKEYQINGTPLGYDRTSGRQADFIEGL